MPEVNSLAKVWVFGKATPGWYVAKSSPDAEYVGHLRNLGYEVRVCEQNPAEQKE